MDMRSFRLDNEVTPLNSEATGPLTEAYSLIEVLVAAFRDSEAAQNDRDAFEAAGLPERWPTMRNGIVPASDLQGIPAQVLSSALSGIGTLVALGAFLASEEAQS